MWTTLPYTGLSSDGEALFYAESNAQTSLAAQFDALGVTPHTGNDIYMLHLLSRFTIDELAKRV